MISRKVNLLKTYLEVTTERVVSLSQPSRLGLICGGSGNLGDDAMVEAARKLLLHTQLIRFGHPKQEARLKQLKLSGSPYFQSVILGGGTLISPTWAEHVRAALQQGLPVWSLGTGVGSHGFLQTDTVTLQEWKPLLKDFHRIGVRGPRSKTTLESMDIPNVEVVGDLALSLALENLKPPADPPRFALNISVPVGQSYNEGEYACLKELELVLPKLIQQGWQPVPIAMHSSDILPIQQLLHKVSLDYIPVPLLSSSDEFFRLVSPCSLTIAVRLHAAVLSCCVGVPPLMLGYRDKCLDFMQSMHLEDWHVPIQAAPPNSIFEKAMLLSDQAVYLRADVLSQAQVWKNTLYQYVKDVSACSIPHSLGT